MNAVLFTRLLLAWGAVYIIGGIAGVTAWAAIKLVLPFVGFVALAVDLIIWAKQRKGSALRRWICVLLALAYMLPMLLTLNVVKLAYPAEVEKSGPWLAIPSLFDEAVTIGWGGDAIEGNLPHAGWGSERWAYDIVMEPYDTGSETLESYGIWGQPVYAPVHGTVVAAYGEEADIAPNRDDFLSLEGNYVYILVEETGTYLLLNHLMQGSLVVQAGDVVQPGDLLGRVGNSGTSSEPHLHIHHQRQDPTKTFYPLFAEGLPLFFLVGEESVMPVKGDTI